MASIVTAVLKATVGLLVNKSRDFAADKLKEGDVTEEQFRNMIVREIDDIKSKLDGLARKDLLTSISFFKEGIVFLYKVLDTKSSGGASTATEQSAVTQGAREKTTQHSLRTLAADVEKVSLAKGMETLDGSGKRALTDAKKRFDDARMKATEAFNNVALSTSDRILAMQYRVMSTILEKIDNPKEAIAACRLCLEELHSMPAVQKSFNVEETGGFLSLFNKNERKEIILSVSDINRVIVRVTEMADGILSKEFDAWPCVNSRGKDVNPLNQQGDYHSRVLPWSFGQEEEEKHKLSHPQSITTNTQGQFIVAENDSIKVFDCEGNFVHCWNIFDELLELVGGSIRVKDAATDHRDNVYVLATSSLFSRILVFDKHGNKCHHFDLGGIFEGELVAVNRNENVFVLGSEGLNCTTVVKVYDLDGRVVNSFELEQNPWCFSHIASANDGEIIIMETDHLMTESKVLVFDSQGNHLRDISMPYSRDCHGILLAH
ncbi:uncharacterized protein LOC144634982 [Oculina patagonica]